MRMKFKYIIKIFLPIVIMLCFLNLQQNHKHFEIVDNDNGKYIVFKDTTEQNLNNIPYGASPVELKKILGDPIN